MRYGVEAYPKVSLFTSFVTGSTAANLSTANTAKEIGSQTFGCFKQTNVNPTIEEKGKREGRESRRKEQAMRHVSEQMAISCAGSMLRSLILVDSPFQTVLSFVTVFE